MALKKSERILGAIHDTLHLGTLPSDDCHVLLVDSQVLYLLQNYAEHEPNYIGRYAKAYYPGGMVQTLEPEDPELGLVSDVARRFRLEVYPVTCDLTAVLEAINLSLQALASKPCCGGDQPETDLPAEPETGPPPVGPDEDFPDIPTYDAYKCQQAATIAYALLQTHRLILAQFPFGLAGVTIAAMGTALQYVFVAAGLVALLTELGAVANIIGAMFQGGVIDVDNIVSRLEALYDEIVCRLYCASGAEAAITAVSDLLDADVPLTPNERTYLKLYLRAVIINRLFTYQPDTLNLVLAPDCSGCGCDVVPCGFIFTDQGVGGGFATGTFRYDGLPFTLTSVEADGGAYHRIWFNTNADCVTCPGNWCVEFVSSTLDTDTNAFARTTQCYHCDGETLLTRQREFQFDDPISAPADGSGLVLGAFYFNNPTPFTVTLRIVAIAGQCAEAPDVADCV